jgi:hypothetical protein
METKLDMRHFFPKVLQVIPDDDYRVYAYLNDGSVRLFDVKPLIRPDTAFAPLADLQFFKEKLRVINDTVAWDIGGNRDPYRCLDIDPFEVFGQPKTADPLG